MKFHIGHSEHELISIEIKNRSNPTAKDVFDSSWLNAVVVIKTGSFSGELANQLRADELVAFYKDLTHVYRSLSGSARFSTIEGWLSLEVMGDGKGHFVLTGKAADDFGHGNALHFKLYFDQTFLAETLTSLGRVTQAFPVLGKD